MFARVRIESLKFVRTGQYHRPVIATLTPRCIWPTRAPPRPGSHTGCHGRRVPLTSLTGPPHSVTGQADTGQFGCAMTDTNAALAG